MALQEIPVGGRQSLDCDEKTPIEAAIVAMNCYMDDSSIFGRNGYLSALAAAVGNGAIPQGMWRFRPSQTSSVTIAAAGGTIYKITDPSSESAQDAIVSSLGTPFGSGDTISATTLGRYLYLCNDATLATFVRVNPDFSLTTIGALPQGAKPTSSFGSLSIVTLHGLTPTAAGGAGFDVLDTDWHRMTDGAAGNCPVGGSLTYTLAAPIVGADNTWLQIFATPPTQQAGYGKLKIELATAAGAFEAVGTMFDGPGAGSPNVIWVNLNQLTAATLASIARIRFTLLDAAGYAGVYGLMYIPAAPASGTQEYGVTFFNSSTGQESVMTTELDVTFSADTVTIPQYHSVAANRTSFIDEGNVGASPDVIPAARNFNRESGLAYPDISVYAPVVTIAGTIPAGSLYPNADTVRLWRLTDTGWRLVKSVTLSSSGTTTYSITDDTGSGTLSHQLYKAGGPAPQTRAMGTFGGRVVTGYQNRLSCSSFEPFAATTGTDPYPQFPAIPIVDADGFSFDLAPSPREQIQGIVGQESGADTLYILTNEGCDIMTDLSPNVEEGGAQSVPYRIFNRGAMGRSAYCFAENMLFWAAHDGVYFASNRVLVDELTKPVRRLYSSYLVPSANTVVFYRKRKLYIVDGTRYMRYDFVTNRWSEGTVTDTFLFAAMWQSDVVANAVLTATATDAFTAADGTAVSARPSDSGNNWHSLSWFANGFTPTIFGNLQSGPNGIGDVFAMLYLDGVPASANYSITANLTHPLNTNSAAIYWEACARISLTQQTHYVAGINLGSTDTNPSTGGWFISKWVNGVYTQLAFSAAAFNLGESHSIRFDCTDQYKRLYVDGTLVCSTNDNSITAAGFAGFKAMNQKTGNSGILADNFQVNSIGPGTARPGTQTWLLSDAGWVMRWQETATSDNGAAIPNWTYSTGYLFSPVRYTVETLFFDTTGPLTVNAYKSSDSSQTRALQLPPGEQEAAGWPDYQGYKMRLALSGTNATQVRRLAWNITGNDGVGS